MSMERIRFVLRSLAIAHIVVRIVRLRNGFGGRQHRCRSPNQSFVHGVAGDSDEDQQQQGQKSEAFHRHALRGASCQRP
jgi:hypothetical protein